MSVHSIKDIRVIIDHFNKYPLKTKKHADYVLLMKAFYIVQANKHLTLYDLHKIVAIKASMNNGLSCKLQTAFPDVVPVTRLLVKNKKITDAYWLAGFISAEGCFKIIIQVNITYSVGFQVRL